MSKYLLGTCPAPPIPGNASIHYSFHENEGNETHNFDGLVQFQCNEGYNASIGFPNW